MRSDIEAARTLVRSLTAELERAPADEVADVLARYMHPEVTFRGVHPFNEQTGPAQIAEVLWTPLRNALIPLQRREDVFFAAENALDGAVWTLSMGHLMGLFDAPWLGLVPTRRIANLRYVEFHRVEDGRVTANTFFCDLIGFLQGLGHAPLPQSTGHYYNYPGPRSHDGVLLAAQPQAESDRTLQLIEAMIADLDELNRSGNDRCPPELLARCWHEDMIWYGPAGIGASFTIERYQQQHQYPFREGLKDKTFNGHVCRIAEGHYAGFFGWPNLSHIPGGGFLGLPASERRVDMRVVDVYRRSGDRLAENWVFIDFPHWLLQQGVDVLARCIGATPERSPTSP